MYVCIYICVYIYTHVHAIICSNHCLIHFHADSFDISTSCSAGFPVRGERLLAVKGFDNSWRLGAHFYR